ncbi:MAG TPA: hypothetical protein DCY88_05495 [Cyanobacteria bacterium UBA11372]|nr:hypothetical protein [Cyanobacteria bacterium UBA11372]
MDCDREQLNIEQILQAYTNAKNSPDICESLVEIARIETLFGNYKLGYETCKLAAPMLANKKSKSAPLNWRQQMRKFRRSTTD